MLAPLAALGTRLSLVSGALLHRAEPDPPLRRAWCGSGSLVLVGGFGTTDARLRPMQRWLERLGYEVVLHTVGVGMGCGGRSVEALRRTVARADRGDGVHVVAHSRGGQFARAAIAAGAPVRGLVTLGSGFDLYRLGLPVVAVVALIGAAGSIGLPGAATLGCLRGPCCAEFRAALRDAVGVPFTSVFSRRDRVVPWRSSRDPHATNVEIGGSHLGLLSDTDAKRAVAVALAAHARRAAGTAHPGRADAG
ncbi:esterase/lipase family protein [Pseudonocardia lutea]|uniref:Esterase/lipase family protein n=1 Tax=Pseudonocardia lutea TaxID=2172015 RepID=A0ABW1I2S3_9PSEU